MANSVEFILKIKDEATAQLQALAASGGHSQTALAGLTRSFNSLEDGLQKLKADLAAGIISQQQFNQVLSAVRPVLEQGERSLQKYGDAAKNAGRDTAGLEDKARGVGLTFGQSFGLVAQSAKIAFDAVMGVFNGMTQLAVGADQADKSAVSFARTIARFGVNAGEADKLVASLADQFGVLPNQVQAAAVTILRAGGSLEDVRKTLTAAGASAAAMSGDVSNAFDNVSKAVATGRSELLESSGIITNASDAYRDYAKSIGVSADSLTDQQKVQALSNAIYRESRFEIEDLDNTMGGLTQAQNENKRAVTDLSNTVGGLLKPSVEAGTRAVTGAIEAGTNWIKSNTTVYASLQALSKGVEGVSNVLVGGANLILGGWRAVPLLFGGTIQTIGSSLQTFGSGILNFFGSLGESIKRATSGDFGGAQEALGKALTAPVDAAKKAIGQLQASQAEFAREQAATSAQIASGTTQIAKGFAQLGNVDDVFRKASASGMTFGKVLEAQAVSANAAAVAAGNSSRANAGLADSAVKVAEAKKLSGIALDDYKAKLDKMTLAQLQAAEVAARAAKDDQKHGLIHTEIEERLRKRGQELEAMARKSAQAAEAARREAEQLQKLRDASNFDSKLAQMTEADTLALIRNLEATIATAKSAAVYQDASGKLKDAQAHLKDVIDQNTDSITLQALAAEDLAKRKAFNEALQIDLKPSIALGEAMAAALDDARKALSARDPFGLDKALRDSVDLMDSSAFKKLPEWMREAFKADSENIRAQLQAILDDQAFKVEVQLRTAVDSDQNEIKRQLEEIARINETSSLEEIQAGLQAVRALLSDPAGLSEGNAMLAKALAGSLELLEAGAQKTVDGFKAAGQRVKAEAQQIAGDKAGLNSQIQGPEVVIPVTAQVQTVDLMGQESLEAARAEVEAVKNYIAGVLSDTDNVATVEARQAAADFLSEWAKTLSSEEAKKIASDFVAGLGQVDVPVNFTIDQQNAIALRDSAAEVQAATAAVTSNVNVLGEDLATLERDFRAGRITADEFGQGLQGVLETAGALLDDVEGNAEAAAALSSVVDSASESFDRLATKQNDLAEASVLGADAGRENVLTMRDLEDSARKLAEESRAANEAQGELNAGLERVATASFEVEKALATGSVSGLEKLRESIADMASAAQSAEEQQALYKLLDLIDAGLDNIAANTALEGLKSDLAAAGSAAEAVQAAIDDAFKPRDTQKNPYQTQISNLEKLKASLDDAGSRANTGEAQAAFWALRESVQAAIDKLAEMGEAELAEAAAALELADAERDAAAARASHAKLTQESLTIFNNYIALTTRLIGALRNLANGEGDAVNELLDLNAGFEKLILQAAGLGELTPLVDAVTGLYKAAYEALRDAVLKGNKDIVDAGKKTASDLDRFANQIGSSTFRKLAAELGKASSIAGDFWTNLFNPNWAAQNAQLARRLQSVADTAKAAFSSVGSAVSDAVTTGLQTGDWELVDAQLSDRIQQMVVKSLLENAVVKQLIEQGMAELIAQYADAIQKGNAKSAGDILKQITDGAKTAARTVAGSFEQAGITLGNAEKKLTDARASVGGFSGRNGGTFDPTATGPDLGSLPSGTNGFTVGLPSGTNGFAVSLPDDLFTELRAATGEFGGYVGTFGGHVDQFGAAVQIVKGVFSRLEQTGIRATTVSPESAYSDLIIGR